MSTGVLNLIIPPSSEIPDWFKIALVVIQNWAKNINGSCLQDATVTGAKLASVTVTNAKLAGDITMSKLDWPEHHIPLSLPGVDVTTTETSPVRCSGLFSWNPAIYPTTGGSWYFEASIGIADAGATATCRLVGATAVGSVAHTGDTLLTLKRSTALTMPVSAANLYADFQTSNASYAATFGGARLVFVPS